jgi:hypothetical protein
MKPPVNEHSIPALIAYDRDSAGLHRLEDGRHDRHRVGDRAGTAASLMWC